MNLWTDRITQSEEKGDKITKIKWHQTPETCETITFMELKFKNTAWDKRSIKSNVQKYFKINENHQSKDSQCLATINQNKCKEYYTRDITINLLKIKNKMSIFKKKKSKQKIHIFERINSNLRVTKTSYPKQWKFDDIF